MKCQSCDQMGGALRGNGAVACRRCWRRICNRHWSPPWGPNTFAVVRI